MDTHNVEHGVIRVTRSLNEIGATAAEVNKVTEQSYNSVDMLSEACAGIEASSNYVA